MDRRRVYAGTRPFRDELNGPKGKIFPARFCCFEDFSRNNVNKPPQPSISFTVLVLWHSQFDMDQISVHSVHDRTRRTCAWNTAPNAGNACLNYDTCDEMMDERRQSAPGSYQSFIRPFRGELANRYDSVGVVTCITMQTDLSRLYDFPVLFRFQFTAMPQFHPGTTFARSAT